MSCIGSMVTPLFATPQMNAQPPYAAGTMVITRPVLARAKKLKCGISQASLWWRTNKGNVTPSLLYALEALASEASSTPKLRRPLISTRLDD